MAARLAHNRLLGYDSYMPYADPKKQQECARKHYADNKEIYKARAKSHREKTRTKIREILAEAKSQPCMDCGNSFPVVCMDFDHRDPSTKKDNVGTLAIRSGSIRVVKEEIEKCDVVCANCHRIRTLQPDTQ